MNRSNNYDKFELKWSISILKKRSKDGSEYWHFLRYKEETESFEGFFNLLKSGDKYITANYIINGNDFTQYLNIYSYHYRLDQPTSNYNFLTFAFNNTKLVKGENIKDKVNLPFQKFAIKQILGENIVYQDVADLYSRKYISEEEFENIVQNVLKSENEDITFYCCCVCADRECGYCSMQITKEEESVRWKIPINYHRPYIFERQEYENAFADFKEFVDNIKQKKA